MIGTSSSEYIIIHILIFIFRFTTPLCLLCVAILILAYGWRALTFPASTILIGFSLVDILYAIFIYFPHTRRLKQDADHPPQLSRVERRALFNRCTETISDFERYIRLWALGADPAEIRRDNVHEFLSWAFFELSPERESKEDAEEIDEYIDTIEQHLGRRLGPGRGKAETFRLTLDAIETRYRSVAWFAIVGLVDFGTHCAMIWNGFHHYAETRDCFFIVPPRFQNLVANKRSPSTQFGYWYRPHTAKDKLPVVFLHGIGIGLYTYIPFLERLNAGAFNDSQIGIIAVEILPVSFRLTRPPLKKSEFLSQVETILETHGWDKFLLASHSYGSVLATHMIKSERLGPRISSVVLIDPVSILLHLPDVAYNFTRRKPRKANEWELWYFASMDPGVAHALGRHFFWKDNIVWKEELLVAGIDGSDDQGVTRREAPRRKVAVCLVERDIIVDTYAVARYLANGEDWFPASSSTRHMTKEGVEILWFPGLGHAQAFDKRKYYDLLCDVIRRYCKK